MDTDNRYNGWTNYETWNCKLWMDNDGYGYGYEDEARELLERHDFDKNEAARALADIIKEAHEEAAPQIESGFFADVLNAAIGAVNWDEIADHIMDDIDVWVAGWNLPGCVPDNAPAAFLDADDAHAYISEELDRAADEIESPDDATDETNEARNALLEASGDCCRGTGEWGRTVNGVHYFVTRS